MKEILEVRGSASDVALIVCESTIVASLTVGCIMAYYYLGSILGLLFAFVLTPQ